MENEKCDVVICHDHNDFKKEIVIKEEDRFLNTLIVGPTGTGKSAQVIAPMIVQDIINENCGITVVDPKEDLAEEIYKLAKEWPTKRRIFYINPTDEDSPKINPFDGEESLVIKNLLKIFNPSFLIKDNVEKQSYDVCRSLISKSIKLLKHFPDIVGQELNIKTYADFITNKCNEARVKLNGIRDNLRPNGADKEMAECCTWFLTKYFEQDSDEYTLSSALRIKIEDIAENKYLQRIMCPKRDGNSRLLEFDRVLAYGDMVIVNTQNTILGPLGKIFGEIIMLSFLNAVFNRKHYCKSKGIDKLIPHFLYVDEFATYSPVLTDMFTQGRSFKVGTHIAVQNRALLRMCGESNTEAQSLLIESNARNIILFPGLNGEDADYYSKQFYNLKPEEICYRPFGQIVYRIVSDRNIMPPAIGLTYFLDEEPNENSVDRESLYQLKGEKHE